MNMEEEKLNSELKDSVLQILGQLYEWKYETEEYDFDTVSVYYTFLCLSLGLKEELKRWGITSASILQNELFRREYKI